MSDSLIQDKYDKLDSELWAAEFSQVMEMYRSISTWTIQSLTVLIVADVTLLGFAFDRKSSGIMFLTGFLPIVALYVISRYRRSMIPVMYVALNLEKSRPSDIDLLGTSVIGIEISGSTIQRLLDIAEDPDFEYRMNRLAKLNVDHDRRPTRGFSRVVSIFAAILQFSGAVVLNQYFHWAWFR